jgi:hypothetical protein
MNKVILSGNVGADPQFKQTEKTAVCNFRIAVNDKFKKDAPPHGSPSQLSARAQNLLIPTSKKAQKFWWKVKFNLTKWKRTV